MNLAAIRLHFETGLPLFECESILKGTGVSPVEDES